MWYGDDGALERTSEIVMLGDHVVIPPTEEHHHQCFLSTAQHTDDLTLTEAPLKPM